MASLSRNISSAPGERERAENESGRGMGAGGEWERADVQQANFAAARNFKNGRSSESF